MLAAYSVYEPPPTLESGWSMILDFSRLSSKVDLFVTTDPYEPWCLMAPRTTTRPSRA